MLDITMSSSPWSSPVILVKKDGLIWFCVDYRHINSITKKDTYPLLRIDATLNTLAGSKWSSTLDLLSGYWQVAMNEEDWEKRPLQQEMLQCNAYAMHQPLSKG